MKYCPKCRFETEQRDAQGYVLTECPSCGIAWVEYLDLMADDAFWPNIVRHNNHDIFCPQCGYAREEADSETLRTNCPACGVVHVSQLVKVPPLSKWNSDPLPRPDTEQLPPISVSTSELNTFHVRDSYLKELRERSCYPMFRSVISVGSFVGYFIAALMPIFAMFGFFKLWGYERWLFVLGCLALSLVIAVLTKLGAEASLMLADSADAIVHSSARNAK